jgi:hypothetical protein
MANKYKGNVRSIFESNYNHTFNMEGTFMYKTYFKFNKDGKIIEYKRFGKKDELLEERITKIDSDGYIIEVIGFQTLGQSDREIYMYDENAKYICSNRFWHDGSLEKTTIYKDNNKGYLKRVTVFNADGGFSFQAKHKYDEMGNNIKTSTESSGFLESVSTKIFNDQGDPEFISSIDGNSSYNYEYDDKGNWIKQELFGNERFKVVLKREIEYC